MGKVVVTLKVPRDLRSELYRAIGEVQARTGQRVYMNEIAEAIIKILIHYLRGDLHPACMRELRLLLGSTVSTARVDSRS